MKTRITAVGAKDTVGAVGGLWSIEFKVTPAPAATDERPVPVCVRVNRPDNTVGTIAATVGPDDTYEASYVLDVDGEYAATVVVEADDGSVAQLGGFTATATLPADEPDPDEPDPVPADAA